MITNIWLKSQPNKRISYPDCYPVITNDGLKIINGKSITKFEESEYFLPRITRVEFRP